VETWRRSAACLDRDPALWFPDQGDQGIEAKRICEGCPVRVACLDHAVRSNEQHGIWGGLAIDDRRALRRLLRQGDPLVYVVALEATVDPVPMVWQSAGVCERCGCRMAPGVRPDDRNGVGATCGALSTYNRGCRCSWCVSAHSLGRSLPARGETRGTVAVIIPIHLEA
jgi:Transcription factor WhiB